MDIQKTQTTDSVQNLSFLFIENNFFQPRKIDFSKIHQNEDIDKNK